MKAVVIYCTVLRIHGMMKELMSLRLLVLQCREAMICGDWITAWMERMARAEPSAAPRS